MTMTAEPSIDELEAQISELEKRIADEPRRIKEEKDRKLTTMPASDEVLEQYREKMHHIEVSRGEIQNIRLSQAKDGILLLFFLLAIISISFWIYNTFQAI